MNKHQFINNYREAFGQSVKLSFVFCMTITLKI